jgi:hypothetical protein
MQNHQNPVKKSHVQFARLGFLVTFSTAATALCVLSGAKDAVTILSIMFVVTAFAMIGCMTLTMDAFSDVIYPPPGKSIFWSPGNRSQAYASATFMWFFTWLVLLVVAFVASAISA